MYLLKAAAQSDPELLWFSNNQTPKYAILSHTWEAGGEEVTFPNIMNNTAKSKRGYRKIEFCRNQAVEDGLGYFWVDSCCIDQKSSAEVSTAVNSMFNWYRNATKCYVYLSDVPQDGLSGNESFRNSRWFTRGWTLQELLAPAAVEFFSHDGTRLGDKNTLGAMIEEVADIPVEVLGGASLSQIGIDRRITWMMQRETTIEEDIVYSGFGLFDVHMPLIYGEGLIKALRRLAEEISKNARTNQQDLTEEESLSLQSLQKMSLATAAAHGYKAVVKHLHLSNSIDINTVDQCGRTPLSWAAGNGHGDIVDILIGSGNANVDLADSEFGWTPLSWAAEYGHLSIVQKLFEAYPSNSKRSILSWAAENGYDLIVKGLVDIDTAYVDLEDAEFGRTPLSWAAGIGHVIVVNQLLATGLVNVDTVEATLGQTPMSLAAANGHTIVVQLLIDTKRADLNAKDKYGQTPLSWAARNGHQGVVKLLLSTGQADVSSKDKYGQTSLHWAAQHGHKSAMKLLMNVGKAEVQVKNNYGQTPLSCAARNGHKGATKLLLSVSTTEVDSKDNIHRRSPLAWAAYNGHDAIVELLLKVGAHADSTEKDEWTPLFVASQNGHTAVAQLLLEAQADVSLKGKGGWTPLLLAVEHGHDSIVSLLIKASADVETANNHGWTPLCLAARYGHDLIIDMLLEADANVDAQTEHGWTPLCLAAKHGHESAVKLLLRADAKTTMRNNDGQTPLALAVRFGHKSIADLLESKFS